MIKKYVLGVLAVLAVPAMIAYAATPTLSLSGSSNSTASVDVTGGEFNSPVTLYYYSPHTGTYHGYSLGSTNAQGSFSGTLNANTFGSLGINWNMPVYVQVGGYESGRVIWPTGSTNTSSNLSFSSSFPNVSVGGSGSVTLSGGNGSYYIASNSNSGGVSASISGNTLNFQGLANGQANIVICSTNGSCGTVTTTVGGSANPTLSSSTINVNHGGQGSITLSGGSGPYSVSVLSGNGVSTTLIGNTLYVNGAATGTTMLNVCSSNGSCSPLAVNVQAQSSPNTGTGSNSGFSIALPLSVGQNLSLSLLGGNGSFYLQSPMSSPALASISGNTLMLNGSMAGSGTVTVCQSGTNNCLPIMLSVSNQTALTGTGGGWLFSTNLGMGASGQDVSELQQRLKDEGYFHANVTGYFGGATKAAVQRYQRAHNISATGFVGVQTRAMLNQ